MLFPSWWEVQVSVVTVAFLVVAFWFFNVGGDCSACAGDASRFLTSRAGGVNATEDKKGMCRFKGDRQTSSTYLVKVELLAAKNLIGANLNGTSDPYAIITCGTEKRFSSMVPSSRNPIWREKFYFSVDELPAEIILTIYGWDIIRRNAFLGCVTISVVHEGETGAMWYMLNRGSGQVCLRIKTLKVQRDSSRGLNVYTGANTQRKALNKLGPMVLCQKHGPLQTIFNLPPDEVAEHSYSCALERSFLYHGRMYISASHICFHSNVFSKKMKVIIPSEDIDEIRRSQHAFINPAITIILRVGSGGHGVPPLGNADGRVRYKFASFWNRNQALKGLQNAAKNCHGMLELENKEKVQPALLDYVRMKQRPALLDYIKEEQSLLDTHGISVRDNGNKSTVPEETVAEPKTFQPFIKEEVLVRIHNDVFPCTAEQFFKIVLDDDSTFTSEYRTARKDFNLVVSMWRASDEYNGHVREVTYRSLCNYPMCPPDISITEWEHVVLSADKKTLVFESIQQAEGVPFASYFECHCRWSIDTKSDTSCNVDVNFGMHFKKWCLLQSKIKATSTEDNKKMYKIKLDAARSYIKSMTSCREIESIDDSPTVIQESK